MNGLVNQGVIGHFASAAKIFLAGNLIGENMGDEIFGIHALKLWRYPLAVTITLDGERAGSVPAPPDFEHRRIQKRLYQHIPHRLTLQIFVHIGKREAVHRTQRDDDAVFVGRRLQLKIERSAKSFAQRQAPGAIDAATVGRMNHHVHIANFIEKPFHDDGFPTRHHAERIHAGLQIFHQLCCCVTWQICCIHHPLHGGVG